MEVLASGVVLGRQKEDVAVGFRIAEVILEARYSTATCELEIAGLQACEGRWAKG